MADQLELLRRLQVVDGELFRLRKQQQEKPRELEQAAAKLAEQEARLKDAEARLKALQLSQKEKEIDLQTKEASVKILQGQLFQVKTNKEYAAMQREIDSLKADNSLLEEAILGAFDAIDQAVKERQREEGRKAELQQQLRAEQARVERELRELGERIAQLEQNRQTLVPNVPKDSLAFYERVLYIRDGLALVPLINDSCGGCNRRLPPQVLNQVYLKAALVACETCNRILYSDDAPSAV